METIEQKFAMFINSLSPEEQRAVAPLMETFADTLGGPPGGAAEAGENEPPQIPQGAEPGAPPLPPSPSVVPGGPPIPPPDPAAMSIGRQQY